MPIRYLAQELYRLTRQVEELEKDLAALGSASSAERTRLETALRQARQDRDHTRAVLEAKKEKTVV